LNSVSDGTSTREAGLADGCEQRPVRQVDPPVLDREAVVGVERVHPHREVFTVDGYLSELTHGLPGAAEHLERLMPGQSRQVSIDTQPAGTTVDVIAAVLDDGTALGDAQVLGEIFAKRARERDALKAVADAFKEVLPATHGAEALAALKGRFTALAQRDDSIPCRAALEAVQTFESKGTPNQIDQSLRTYAEFVTKQYELAARHAQRK